MPGVFVNRDEGSKGKGGLGSPQSHARVACCECRCGQRIKERIPAQRLLEILCFPYFSDP